MANHARPKNRNEQEIAGYRDVLALIHESHDYIDITPTSSCSCARCCTAIRVTRLRGVGRIVTTRSWREADGRELVRFCPVPAVATPLAMGWLCDEFNRVMGEAITDSLVLITCFVPDFTCVHPFTDDNSRMSRLLTLLLLYRAGFVVGRYASIEEEINRTRDAYYDTLQQSSLGWNEGGNDYVPFTGYMLGTVLAACRDFESRVEGALGVGTSKSESAERVLAGSIGKVTKSDIVRECPGISLTTIECALHDLFVRGKVEKVGAGRATGYVWKG